MRTSNAETILSIVATGLLTIWLHQSLAQPLVPCERHIFTSTFCMPELPKYMAAIRTDLSTISICRDPWNNGQLMVH